MLHAVSKEHGPTLIGTYKVGGQTTEGVAVLKNDRWYKYDDVQNKLYGMPIEDFYPVGAPLFRAPTGSAFKPNYMALFNSLAAAKRPDNVLAFNKGVNFGNPHAIPGYQPQMNLWELRELIERPNWPPYQLGVLSKELKNKLINHGNYSEAIFKYDVKGPGTTVTPLSQAFYNAHVDLPSQGECAGLTYAMAMAIQTGKEDQLLKNMMTATQSPHAAVGTSFINDVRRLQDTVTLFDDFHLGGKAVQRGCSDIIGELTDATETTLLKIATKDHALLAAVRIESGKKEWFFYDPNGGLAKFTSLESMKAGIENVLSKGKIAALLNTDTSTFGGRVFSVSKFGPTDLGRPGAHPDVVKNLSNAVL